jgi:hypothetical protein
MIASINAVPLSFNFDENNPVSLKQKMIALEQGCYLYQTLLRCHPDKSLLKYASRIGDY